MIVVGAPLRDASRHVVQTKTVRPQTPDRVFRKRLVVSAVPHEIDPEAEEWNDDALIGCRIHFTLAGGAGNCSRADDHGFRLAILTLIIAAKRVPKIETLCGSSPARVLPLGLRREAVCPSAQCIQHLNEGLTVIPRNKVDRKVVANAVRQMV